MIKIKISAYTFAMIIFILMSCLMLFVWDFNWIQYFTITLCTITYGFLFVVDSKYSDNH